jgi:hypothetical protein
MIERNITAAQVAALLADELAAILFVDIDWPGERVRVHTGLGERKFNGETYLGVGELGGVGDFVENTGTSPSQLTVTLKVLDGALVALVMNDSPEGKEIAVHLGILDDNKQIAHEIPYVLDANVSKFGVKRGDIARNIPYVLAITCSDWFVRWNQPPNNARTTNEAQQNIHPGDRIFDLTELIASSPLSSLPVKTQVGNNNNNNGRRWR